MKRASNKSQCPINLSLETLGDSWSLLIIRDIVFAGKRSFREFLVSEEGIATNILQARLSDLVAQNVLQKTAHPTDKRKELYSLTEKGIALVPVLVELSDWSLKFNPSAVPIDLPVAATNKQDAIKAIQASLR